MPAAPRDSRSVLRPHEGAREHVLRQRPRRARRVRASGLRAARRRSPTTSCQAAGATVHKGGTYVCMEGPQFSTLAESKLYRSWGMDIIGMTNLQEAKLAREAEICYATIALVTDYDCWHPDHDSVTVDMIIAEPRREREDRPGGHRRGGLAAARTTRTCECANALAACDHHAARGRPRQRQARPRADHREVHAVAVAPMRSDRESDPTSTDRRPTLTTRLQLHQHVHRRHRFDRLRLPDVVSREVHRALPAGAHEPRQPQLPGRLDGQAARRLRAQHRLHAGAARRASAADGARRGRTSTTIGAGSRPPASIRRSCTQVADKFTASFFCSTDSESNQIASFYTGAMANAGELSFRTVDGLDGDHLAERSGRHGPVRGGVPDARDPVHLGSGSAVRADERRRAARRARRLGHRDLQRLRVRADPAEDRPRRGRRSSSRAAR